MATHDGKKHTRQSLRDSPEFRELAEIMAGIAPDRRGDAIEMAETEETEADGKEESTENNIAGGITAGDCELREIVVPIESGHGSQSRGDSEVHEGGT